MLPIVDTLGRNIYEQNMGSTPIEEQRLWML
jgi:hypothetical protein